MRNRKGCGTKIVGYLKISSRYLLGRIDENREISVRTGSLCAEFGPKYEAGMTATQAQRSIGRGS
jgi:hypothetical protein